MGLNQFTDLTVHEFSSIYTRTFISDSKIQVMTQKVMKSNQKSH
jgi:hypothetical protein